LLLLRRLSQALSSKQLGSAVLLLMARIKFRRQQQQRIMRLQQLLHTLQLWYPLF
jgi:hypothetical protein